MVPWHVSWTRIQRWPKVREFDGIFLVWVNFFSLTFGCGGCRYLQMTHVYRAHHEPWKKDVPWDVFLRLIIEMGAHFCGVSIPSDTPVASRLELIFICIL